MTSLDDLDFSHAGMTPSADAYVSPLAERDPWLRRRSLHFGASDVPVLLVALGRRGIEWLPTYLQADARVTNRTAGQPRIIAQKAGIIPPRKRGSAADRGTEREQELLATWRALLEHGQADDDVDPASVQHASTVPREFWPLVDRRCRDLAATLDAWGRDALFGELVVIECKCSVRPYDGAQAHHAVQVQAQLAVTGADRGIVIEGPGWAAWHGDSARPRTYAVERSDSLISEIREVCAEGWARVEKLREERSE